jgi:hypothetical protein
MQVLARKARGQEHAVSARAFARTGSEPLVMGEGA